METGQRDYRGSSVAFTIVMTVLALAAGLLAGGSVAAQGGPELSEPQPLLPEVVEGTATWTVKNMTYQGEFPEGMTFSIRANSDAGAVTNARVVWRHAPGNNTQRSQTARLDEGTGLWTAQWNHIQGNVPPWVLVRYHWELTDEKGNRYSTAEQDEVYADADNLSRWHSAESEDAVVYWIDLSDDYGQQALQAMADQREFYRRAWGGLLPYRPRIILYGMSAMTEYEEALGRQAQAGGGITTGTTSDDWGGTIQLAYFDTPYDLAYGTTLHEIAHLYQGEFAHLPVSWFVEGNAEFFSIARGDSYRSWARQRLQSGDPLSFEVGFSIRGRTFRDGYQLGATVFDYLAEAYGLEAHRQIWEQIGRNVPAFSAIEAVTGVSIQQFEQDWRHWLGVNAPPPTAVPLPTPRFDYFSMPTPTFMPPGG